MKSRKSLVVNTLEADAQSRHIAMRLVALTLRMMERWRALVDDNDSAMVLMAVALINIEGLTQDDLVALGIADLKKGAGPDELKKCNVSSVAAATGLHRETARRKIVSLIENGLLVRHANRHVYLNPDLRIREEMVRTVGSQLKTLAKASDDLLRAGVLDIVEDLQ